MSKLISLLDTVLINSKKWEELYMKFKNHSYTPIIVYDFAFGS